MEPMSTKFVTVIGTTTIGPPLTTVPAVVTGAF